MIVVTGLPQDPFSLDEDAGPDDFDIRPPWKGKPQEKGCDPFTREKRKKVDLNPIARRHFEREGYTYARVEHANTYGSVNQDLWGFADYLAVRPGEILLVQVTSLANASTREKKARKAPELWKWLEAGGRFQVHAWHQPAGPGTRWEMRIREVRLEG